MIRWGNKQQVPRFSHRMVKNQGSLAIMDCDETAHHPKGAAKTDEYITVQAKKYKQKLTSRAGLLLVTEGIVGSF